MYKSEIIIMSIYIHKYYILCMGAKYKSEVIIMSI